MYINDLPDCLSCNVSLFADNTIIFTSVNNSSDSESSQKDINNRYEWSIKWGMSFNIKKTQLMIFKRPNFNSTYTLAGEKVSEVEEAKYLGVIIQNNLKFDI